MKIKKLAVIGLAVLMASTSAPFAEVFAATTAKTEINLAFTSGDNGDPSTASILTGGSTTLKVAKPAGYTEANPAFTVTGPKQEEIGSDIVSIKNNELGSTKDVTVAHSYMTELDQAGGLTTFTIQGNYYAMIAEGKAYETAQDGSKDVLTKVISTQDNAITEYSELTIVCDTTETAATDPHFIIQEGSQPEGVFEKFAGGSIYVSRSDKDPKKEKVVTFELTKGGQTIAFDLYPKQIYINYDPDTNQEVSRDNYIRRGTVFHLVFTLPTSNQLFLNVLTPTKAVGDIADEIGRNDGVNNKSFIVLDGEDRLKTITKAFRLKSETRQYNADFTIDWEWIPDNADDKNVVIIPSTGTWRTASVYPKEDDVSGTLRAAVSYTEKEEGKDPKTYTKTRDIPIKIRGTGKPAHVTQYSEIVGSGQEHFFKQPEEDAQDDGEAKLPRTKQMDVFKGDVENFKQPDYPYQYKLLMKMGQKNASSQYAIITATAGGNVNAVSLQTLINDTPSNYTLGDKINNPKKDVPDQTGEVILLIQAREPGTVELNIKFYVTDANDDKKVVEAAVQPDPIRITVRDTSPSSDASLKELILKDQDGEVVPLDFSPVKPEYQLQVPNRVTSVTVKPTRNDQNANPMINMTVSYRNDKNEEIFLDAFGGKDGVPLESGHTSLPIDELIPNISYKISLTVTAQNPQVTMPYVVNLMREPPSDDASLKSLGFYDESDTAQKTNLIKSFDPDVKLYHFTVPFGTRYLKVVAEANHENAKLEYSPELVKRGLFGQAEWFDLDQAAPGDDGYYTMDITVRPESSTPANTYQVKVRREDPSEISTLASLAVYDADEKTIRYTPAFKASTDTYRVQIPYSTDKLKLMVKPTDPLVSRMEVVYDDAEDPVPLKSGVISDAIPIEAMSPDRAYHELKIRVVSEAGEGFETVYYLRVERAEPDSNALLKTLVINDQDGKAVKNYSFQSETFSYAIAVPYETTKVSFTPTTVYAGATVTIRDAGQASSIPQKVASGTASSLFNLNYTQDTQDTTFEIKVMAEDGREEHAKIYTVKFTRGAPSDDARLKYLTVEGAGDLSPLFIASKYNYEATVDEGALGVIITPTANHPGATITVNGDMVESGSPSDLIELIEIYQEIPIVVTAQDGVTQLTYKITFTNQNLIEKTDNADLRNLTLEYGVMTPRFQPSVTEYELSVTEDTWSVELIPRTADKLATVKVFWGTKEIGDKNGRFAQAIEDGENDFTIEVTSSDKSTVKEYNVAVYRNEEDKMKTLAVLQAEDVDFESDDVITIMIDRYPRVSAEVFNELKNYPEKKIIFQGNDYSISFNASDIKRTVPSTEIYNFKMSFDTPDEDDIYDLMNQRTGNEDLYNRAVMVYFEHEGSLPAPGILNLSLGRSYANTNLFWHYYNADRERIDYYGMVKTNSRGTFAVKLDHFSTYIVTTRHRILGSELKDTDDAYTATPSGDLINSYEAKPNPVTGATEEMR